MQFSTSFIFAIVAALAVSAAPTSPENGNLANIVSSEGDALAQIVKATANNR